MLILNSISRKTISFFFCMPGKVKCSLLLLSLVFFSKGLLFGQYTNDKVKVRCILTNTTVGDNQDLRAKIIITNNSDSTIFVYRELEEGIFNDILGDNMNNFKLIVQRKVSKQFQQYSNGVFIDPPPSIDTNDNLRKIRLLPKASVANYFHVDSRYKFDIGDYRMKCLYWNNIHVNKSIESNWVYFRVVKPIYVKHYVSELRSTGSTKFIQ